MRCHDIFRDSFRQQLVRVAERRGGSVSLRLLNRQSMKQVMKYIRGFVTLPARQPFFIPVACMPRGLNWGVRHHETIVCDHDSNVPLTFTLVGILHETVYGSDQKSFNIRIQPLRLEDLERLHDLLLALGATTHANIWTLTLRHVEILSSEECATPNVSSLPLLSSMSGH